MASTGFEGLGGIDAPLTPRNLRITRGEVLSRAVVRFQTVEIDLCATPRESQLEETRQVALEVYNDIARHTPAYEDFDMVPSQGDQSFVRKVVMLMMLVGFGVYLLSKGGKGSVSTY